MRGGVAEKTSAQQTVPSIGRRLLALLNIRAALTIRALPNIAALLSTDKRELIVGSGSAFAAKLFSATLAFALAALITRALGAHDSGYYFWALALSTVLATFARGGFDQVLLRFMAAALADARRAHAVAIFRYAMRRTAGVSIAIAAAMAALAPLLAQWVFVAAEVAPLFAIMFAASIFLALNTLLAQSLLAAKRVLLSIFVVEIGVPLLMAGELLIARPQSGTAVAAMYLLACAALSLAFAGYWRRRGDNSNTISNLPVDAVQPTILDSASRAQLDGVRRHLFWVSILSLIAQWGGVILLGWFADPAQVALFSIALRVAMLNSFILRAVNAVIGARFAELYHRADLAGLRSLALQSSRLMALVAIPLLLLLLYFARPLLSIFGEEFAAAAPCLIILSIGQFINVITGAVCLLLEMTGGEARLRRFELVSALLMVALGLALVPQWGALGAAIATAVAVGAVNLLAVYEVKRRFDFNILKIW